MNNDNTDKEDYKRDLAKALDTRIKAKCLDAAIKANVGLDYNNEYHPITNPDKIVEAAKKFEAYLKDS